MSWAYNKPPDDKFRAHFRNICTRPAMYIGKENYELTATLLEGMALGYQDWNGGFMHSLLHEEFQQFLSKKYRQGNSTYSNVVWSQIIPLALKQDGSAMGEKQMIDRLLADFEDFNNVLIRMVVATSDGDDPSGVEDA